VQVGEEDHARPRRRALETWTGLPVEQSIRMTEDRDKWRKYVDGVANARIEDGYRTEQNSLLAAVDLVRLL